MTVPSTTCRSVSECIAASGVSDEVVSEALGPIPFKLVENRIKAVNPDLNPLMRRVSGVGGLAATFLGDMQQTQVDLRDPWSSTFTLLYRLRDILYRRMNQLARVFDDEIFTRPHDWPEDQESKRHYWMACQQPPSPYVLQGELIFRSLAPDVRLLAQDLSRETTDWALWCRGNCGADSEHQGSLGVWYNRCKDSPLSDTSLSSFALAGLDAPFEATDPRVVADGLRPTRTWPIWPRVLLHDPSLWMLVMFEELAGPALSDKLWTALTEKGVYSLYGNSLVDAAMMQLYWGRRFYMRDLYNRTLELLDEGKLSGSVSASDIRSMLASARSMVLGAGLPFPQAAPYPDRYLKPISFEDFYTSMVPYSSTARSWAGETYQLPPPDVLPGETTDPPLDSGSPLVPPSASKAWLWWLGAGAIGLGALLWSRRST